MMTPQPGEHARTGLMHAFWLATARGRAACALRDGDKQPVAGLDDRVVPHPEHELTVVDQAEHEIVTLVPHGAERPADRVSVGSISLSRWWSDPTSSASMSPACGASRLFASVDAISACAETT
jgi:hypothetical protein